MKKIALLLFAMSLIGCSHVPGVFRTVDGTAFDLEGMEQVQPGMSSEEVFRLVGRPVSVSEEGSRTVHRYYMVREKTDTDRVAGIVPIRKKTTEMYEVLLNYENGVVTRKQLTRSVEKPKEKGE
ncbi:MAG: outer membrane protein assembly factor BamE [Proteobacteria bacterium]|nr:outer membrane protein assembly factor BamE [Pseudomonadota bacterium]